MRLLQGYHERQRDTWERALAQAWFGAALKRQKVLKPLQDVLHPPQTKTLTPEEVAHRKAEFEEMKQRMASRLQRNGTT